MNTTKIFHQLTNNNVIVMRSDTIYGLMVSSKSNEAVEKLYEVKGRENKPGTLIAASIDQLAELGFNEKNLERAKVHWPGPVSVVLPAPDTLGYLHMGLHSLAVRIPDDKNLVEILKQTGPLATTSANRPGEPVVTTIQEAKDIFGDSVALYVDGGEADHPASTILKLTEDGFTKLR